MVQYQKVLGGSDSCVFFSLQGPNFVFYDFGMRAHTPWNFVGFLGDLGWRRAPPEKLYIGFCLLPEGTSYLRADWMTFSAWGFWISQVVWILARNSLESLLKVVKSRGRLSFSPFMQCEGLRKALSWQSLRELCVDNGDLSFHLTPSMRSFGAQL